MHVIKNKINLYLKNSFLPLLSFVLCKSVCFVEDCREKGIVSCWAAPHEAVACLLLPSTLSATAYLKHYTYLIDNPHRMKPKDSTLNFKTKIPREAWPKELDDSRAQPGLSTANPKKQKSPRGSKG